MDTNKWNITGIITELLKEEFTVSYSSMAKAFQCTTQTLSDWRKGIRKPQKSHINVICTKLPKMLGDESGRHDRYLSLLKAEFHDAGSKVKVSVDKCDSVETLLRYLYNDFEKELGEDKLYELLNDSDANILLRQITLEKFKINEKYTPIFQTEELGAEEKKEYGKKKMKWSLDLDHCFILKFRGYEKRYTYKVLVNFNFNHKEHELAGHYAEARDAAKLYGVNMILLFGNAQLPEDEIRFFMDSNIYMEEISLHEITDKKLSKDYIYSSENVDMELERLANQYTDIILGRLGKYYSVIFKNILFDTKRSYTAKQRESYIFWDAKYATRHHLNFQECRITELMEGEDNVIPYGGNALAIGYLSFPCMLRLTERYEKIYLMDNSNASVKMYEEYIKEIAPDLLKKAEFVTFTSAMFEAVTEKYELYHSIDFILIGTGSGSFIKKLQNYYRMCNSWLKMGGVLYISFLNSEFLYEDVDRVTTEQNFEFIPVIDKRKAVALISNSAERFELYCETYDCNLLKDYAEKYFEVIKMYSYPLASVLEGTHKSRLQNILKELDKEYSRHGFSTKTFSNSRGYYVDGVLRKRNENLIAISEPEEHNMESVTFHDTEKYREHYLKTLLLAKITREESRTILPAEIYVVLLSTRKRLPETSNNEIYLGGNTFRLLDIAEINTLGIEYRNISPFLKACSTKVRLRKYYDEELVKLKKSSFYIGDGSRNSGYKVEHEELMKLLKEYKYNSTKI